MAGTSRLGFAVKILGAALPSNDAGRWQCDPHLRMSLTHIPSQYVLLNVQDETIAEKSIRGLQAQATLLDRMGLVPEAVVVTHVGGVYSDKEAGLLRFIRPWDCHVSPVT